MLDFSLIDGSWGRAALICLCGLLVGMSKTGVQMVTLFIFPVMALVFGARESTGVILPILCFADLIAVAYYRRQADFGCVLRLLPAAVAGFFAAVFAGNIVPRECFGALMAFAMFASLISMFFGAGRRGGGGFSRSFWAAQAFGFLGGFATMIGNAAGPVMAAYLLAMNLPKLAFVGTSAWFFLAVNYLKIPLQVFFWKNISAASLSADLIAAPFVVLGAVLGVYLVKVLPEKSYRAFIVAMTLASTIALLF